MGMLGAKWAHLLVDFFRLANIKFGEHNSSMKWLTLIFFAYTMLRKNTYSCVNHQNGVTIDWHILKGNTVSFLTLYHASQIVFDKKNPSLSMIRWQWPGLNIQHPLSTTTQTSLRNIANITVADDLAAMLIWLSLQQITAVFKHQLAWLVFTRKGTRNK